MMRVRRCLPVLALAATPLVSLLAQQPRRPAAGAAGATGSVRGVVYDSLLRAPLEGAHVWIAGTGFGTVTDVGGRFRLDSVPAGRRIIAFEHPDLDSAGFSSTARRIDVVAGRPTVVELDVPSLATMSRAACGMGGPIRNARDSGVVFGAVQDVQTHTRLAGAHVSVSWVAARLGIERVEVSHPGIDLVTDSLGNYYACGVPREYIATVSATAGSFASGVTELLLGARGIARRDLGISRDSAQVAGDSASGGLRRGRAILAGVVLDEDDRPRPGARASVDDAAGEGYADEEGRFTLRNLPAGSQTLMVRMVGYTAVRVPVLLRNGDTTRVSVRMRGLTVLDTIRVTASSRIGQINLDELERRLRVGTAIVRRSEELKRRSSMRAVFQDLPQLTVIGQSTASFQLYSLGSGRYLSVDVWVDGVRATSESVQSYRPDQIIAVEWYPRGSQAPIQYQSLRNPESGVLLVWTRFIR